MQNRRRPTSQPATLAELRELASAIAGGQSEIPLGRRATQAFIKMLENPEAVATDSISGIARITGVDAATLSRLGQRLGFEGFADLQRVFKEHIANAGQFYVERVTSGVASAKESGQAHETLPLAQAECRRIIAATEEIGDAQLDHAASILHKARRVHVLGLRGAHAVAHFLALHLMFIRRDVFLLGNGGGLGAGELNQINSDDVMLAITFRPFARLTLSACEIVSERGTPVISVTNVGSPLAYSGDRGATLATGTRFFYDSSLVAFFVAEMLIAKLVAKAGKHAIEVAQERIDILKRLDLETE